MRYVKKWSLLALLIVQIVCTSTMNVLAAKGTNDEVEVTLTTNKSEYSQGEEIELFLDIKNCGENSIENVLIETVVPSQYIIAEGYDYQKEIDSLIAEQNLKLNLKYIVDVQEPEVSTTPENTSMPEETTAPENTAEPEGTAEPEDTAAPEGTAEPEGTAAPEGTAEPEGTAAPEGTAEPESTVAPENSVAPDGTEVPQTTAIPQVYLQI